MAVLGGRVSPRLIRGAPVSCGAHLTAETQKRRGQVWLADPSVQSASCRQTQAPFHIPRESWPTWKSALHLLLVDRGGAEARRVGRVRSPVCAGVGDAHPAAKFDSCFPRSNERGYGAQRGAVNSASGNDDSSEPALSCPVRH